MIRIRKGNKADLPEVLDLIRELAAFERAPQEVTNTLSDMERDGFGENPVFELLVACREEKVIGMAIYFVKYSTWKGKGIYLDDIVVKAEYRNQGAGKLLFDAVMAEARKAGARQLHWQVLDWNEQAIRFYKSYQPAFDREWVNCKLTEKQLRDYGT